MEIVIIYYCWPLVYAFLAALAVHAVCVRYTPLEREPIPFGTVFITCCMISVAGLVFFLEDGQIIYPGNSEAFLITAVAAAVGALAYVVAYRMKYARARA